jgi:hypothetical protein
MNTVQQTLQTLRAPIDKKVAKATDEHNKNVAKNDKIIKQAEADLKKTINQAKAAYETKVSQAKTSVAKSETVKTEAEAERQSFNEEVARFQNGHSAAPKSAPAKANGVKTKKVAAKPGPKPKAASAKAKGKKASKGGKGGGAAGAKRALEGRREVMDGTRPPIKDALRLILGKKTMRSRDITLELKARNWVPNSASIESYVPYVLSSNSKGAKAVFEPVKGQGKGRGWYRVRAGAPPMKPEIRARFGGETNGVAHKAEPAKAAPKAKAAAKAAPKGKPGQRKCSVAGCGVVGHNKRGHAAYVKAQKAAAKAATAPKKAAAKAAPKKAAAPKAAKAPKAAAASKERAGKGQQKCSVPGCGVLGHNKKGHAKYVAAQAAGAAPAPAPKAAAKKAEPATPAPKAEEAKPAATEPFSGVKSADEILAGADKTAAPKDDAKDDEVMRESAAAFGG